MKGDGFKGDIYEKREQRVDIKSFVYFSISFILFHIMNIITIHITLCRKYILSSEHRERWSRTPEWIRSTSAFHFAAVSALRQIPLWCNEPHVRRSSSSGKLKRNLPPRYIYSPRSHWNRSNHISVFYLNSLSISLSLFFFSFSLSHRLGSRQTCAERFDWPKRPICGQRNLEKRTRPL